MSTDLIKQIRKRPTDEGRWATWYQSVYPRLYYVAFRLANGNADTARDFAQETFARFLGYRAIERVENEQHALAFLIKTCRNLAIDRNARANDIQLDDAEKLESIAAPEQPLNLAIDLDRALQELEPQDRQLILWARDGLSVSDIARKLDVSYTAAGVRLHRLKKRLRAALS